MQNAGLEWVFRLMMDPRRLWKRYLKHHPRFLFRFALQYARHLKGAAITLGVAFGLSELPPLP